MRKLIWLLVSVGVLAGVSCKQASYKFNKKKEAQPEPKPVLPTAAPTPAPQVGPNEFVGEFGFRMKCTPATAKVGESVVCEGTCGDNATEELEWQYGDGQSGKGNKSTHAFKESRKHVVEAICKDKDGKPRKGSLILEIVPAPNPNPGQQPGQKPGQNPGQKV